LKTLTRIGASTLLIAVCFFVVGCGGVGIANAGVPAISQIIPQAVTAGSGNTTVEIVGSRINNSTVVLWNGSPLATTMLDSSTVASPVESASLAVPGVAQVQLMNTATGVKSDAVELSIASANTAALTITTTSLPNGVVGTPYSATLTASGGNQPYSWSFASGRMPAGLSLNSSGVISGTPTAAGTFSVGLTLKDKSKPPQQKFIALTLIISKAVSTTPPPTPLTVSSSTLAAATFGTAYSQTLAATGGSPAYTWSVSSGSLPPGLSLASSGAISGTPTQGGAFAFTASVIDSGSPQQSKTVALSISVNETPLKITTSSLAAGTAGNGYSQTLGASGGYPGYTWSIASGSLPAGLTLSSSGMISGTPTASGSFAFTASVSDRSNPVQTLTAALNLNISAPQLKVIPTSFAQGIYGRPYSGTLQATGGAPGYRWAIASGNLPIGLALDNSTGNISGTPTGGGTAAFTAAVTDTANQTASALVTINVAATPLTITASTPAAANSGVAYSQTLQAIGGTAPYQWSITAGKLPAGLTLSPTSGIISGTTSVTGTANFTATVTDNSNPIQTASLPTSLIVNSGQTTLAPLRALAVIAPGSLSGIIGSNYSLTLSATGGTSPYGWAITFGSLPAGLQLSATGTIVGTPAQGTSGSYSFTVTASDAETPVQTASANISMTISGATVSPLAIASSTLASGIAGTAYNQSLQATGGTPAYSWSLTSGSLPAGLALSSAGVISGTPSAAGSSTFTASVSDSGSPLQSKSVTTSIAIAAAQASSGGTTWFVRPDGGTRYSANVANGQCNGRYDAPYPGSGVNQNCAFNDVRYLWSDNSSAPTAWVIAGGDTVIIRGCTALGSQTSADNPHCRLGYDNPNNGWAPNAWCGLGIPNSSCFNPPIPAGTSGQHTRILGACAVTSSCNPAGVTNPMLYASNLTQLYGGFGLFYTLDLRGAKYVDIEGIELTTHNGTCSTLGTPELGGGCSVNPPYSDYATQGIVTNNATANITLQDVYIHGFNSSGLFGPIGGPITMTRMFVGFNAFAGWNFDDGHNTPDGPGSSITANHVIMEGNGCQEEYPIVDGFPARRCWDDNSTGFGDSWSGQDTEMDSMYCNDCQQLYNTKDGFIGPHTYITNLTIINSVSSFNMGQQWKWGGGAVPQTVTFQNNLTVSGCQRMSAPLAGAPSGYNQYLSDFCRAAGNVIASDISSGSTWTIANNSFVFNSPTLLDIACPNAYPVCTGSTINWFNNVILGYPNMPTVFGLPTPAVFYNNEPQYITINKSNEVEYGLRNGSPCGGTVICSDPLFVNEPAQSATAQSALDVFNLTPVASSFYPAGNSPMVYGGATGGSSTDYFGVSQTSPSTIGAVVRVGK
jgi:hypothetical protein